MQSRFYFFASYRYDTDIMNHDNRYIDLHIHSNYSDGAFSPAELVQRAKTEELTTIAIADHDSVAGVTEGITAGAAHGIEVIPAVELSVQFKTMQDVHLLGYGMNYTGTAFQEKLNSFRERREHRNREILDRVNALLIEENRTAIPVENVLSYARDTIGRPHIARALLEKGYASNVEDAFRHYLVPCNVPKLYWPINDAIDVIRALGGVTVLAHPTTITTDHHELRKVITELTNMGLDGIEVFNNLVQPHNMEFLRRLADEQGLLVTGGSDFHGIEEGLEMGKGRGGLRFSSNLLPPLKSRIHQRHSPCSGVP